MFSLWSQGGNKKKKEESPTLTNGRGGINHNVISSGTKRQRLASSSSVHSNPAATPACDPSKDLRVNIKKMSSPEVQAALSAGSADETDAEEEDSARYVLCN